MLTRPRLRSHHPIQERRTSKADAGERGVDLQRLRNSDAALRAEIVVCARERRKRNVRTTRETHAEAAHRR